MRSSWWTPWDWALVTGPGTPISGRLSRSVQCAVFRAPLRTAASTITVPSESPAMSRLRVRKRSRVGEHPGASSDTTAPCCAEVVQQRLVRHGVRPVDAAGEHRHGRASPGQGSAVRGLVDAERRTGHHRGSRAAEVGADLAGHLRAVRRGGARPDHGDG